MDNYRAIIEVLKFADPADVLRQACCVHSKWNEVCASRELWHLYLPEETDLGSEHPKLVYHRRFTRSVFIVLSTKLLRFYIDSKTWSDLSLSKPVEIDYMSSVTRPELDFLFVCGAMSRRENTFKVGVRSGEVRLLSALNPHRTAMGILTHEGAVYAFNGKKGPESCSNCNKFDVKREIWVQLQFSQEKRSFFNPCLYRGQAYLVGGTSEMAPCEVYNLNLNSFAPISVEIAFPNAVSVISGSNLLAISNKKVATIKLSPKISAKKTKAKLPVNLEQYFYSGFDPILKNGLLIVVHRGEGRVVELNVATLQWESYSYEGDIIAPRKRVWVRGKKKGPQQYNYGGNAAPAVPTGHQN